MNWWDTLKFWKPKREDASEAPATPKATRTTPRTGAGLRYFMFPDTEPLQIATVYRCVQLLSDSVAGLHLQYMKLKNDRYQEDTNSDLHYLLSVQPQPEMSIFDFWSMAVKLMLIDGNAYIYPRYVRGALDNVQLDSLDSSIVIRSFDPGTTRENIQTTDRMGGAGQRVTMKRQTALSMVVTYAVLSVMIRALRDLVSIRTKS